MNPVLRISTTPIKISVSVKRASLEAPGSKQLPRMNVSTQKGGHRITTTPGKLNIDSYAARASTGYSGMNTFDMMKEEAQRGKQLAAQGTVRTVEDGNALARGSSPVQLAVKHQRANFQIETVMEFIPKVPASVTYDGARVDIDYTPDKSDYNWEHIDAQRMVYNPGYVELAVEQYPAIEIEYVGEPIYVPPSANPNYEPVLDISG